MLCFCMGLVALLQIISTILFDFDQFLIFRLVIVCLSVSFACYILFSLSYCPLRSRMNTDSHVIHVFLFRFSSTAGNIHG